MFSSPVVSLTLYPLLSFRPTLLVSLAGSSCACFVTREKLLTYIVASVARSEKQLRCVMKKYFQSQFIYKYVLGLHARNSSILANVRNYV
jgi:hypothetical protein